MLRSAQHDNFESFEAQGRLRPSNFASFAFLIAVAAYLGSPATVAAQDAGVELRLGSTTLEVGEAVDAQLICTNTGQPEPPQFSVPAGLDLQITNPTPAQFSQMSIVNGRRSQKTTYTYSLRLTALKEGAYTLSPISVVGEASTYQTAPVRITVQKKQVASQSEQDQFVFVRMSVEPRSLYVTQSFTATLVIGIRKVEIDGRVVDMENLLQTVDGSASQLSIFATRFSSSELTMVDSTGQRHPYVLFKSTREVRAEEVGAMPVGPVFLKVNYPTSLRRGFFGGMEIAQSRKETARADAITVDVKGPPEQGRPADFTGAIGQFTMQVEVKPTRVEQGRPVTLSLAIQGAPLEGLAGPDLTKQAELASRFDFATDELTGDIENRAKVFRRAIFPKQHGEQTVPPIAWSYFDPHAERYISLTSKPIPLVVDPASPGSVAMSPGEIEASERNGAVLKLVHGGISPNYVDPGLVLADTSLGFSPTATVAALALPPLLCLTMTLTVRHRSRLKSDVRYSRRRRARRDAQRLIDRALRDGNPARQLTALSHAMTSYLADRFCLPPGTLTPHEVRTLLVTSGTDVATSGQVAGFLENCDAALYARGAIGTLSPSQAAANVRHWIERIERNTP